MLKTTLALIQKDLTIEWRQKYAIGGIFLYVLATAYLIYIFLAQQSLNDKIEYRLWMVLFWMTILFTAVNAIAKSFSQEDQKRQLYYYTIVSPQAVILSKMIYNFFLMILLSVLCALVFLLIIGNPVQNMGVFFLGILAGGSGFSFVLSMISAIASKAEQNTTLMAILGFPVILPFLMLLQKAVSKAFIIGFDNKELLQDFAVLFALDILLISLSLILFPYLWKE
ncbi:MAG: heme exporter protein CcmB [Chitinophagales bacterium]